MAEPVLEIRDLVIRYRRRELFASPARPAVNGVSFSLAAGETLGIVGESGSGKSSLLRAILGLVSVESGTIRVQGRDWLSLPSADLRRARQAIGVVAQNPFLSLSPRLTVAEILAEPLTAQRGASVPGLLDITAQLLEQCGLPADFLSRRAHELSGGQAQRVAVARALALKPRLLVLDEPTSALDVSVQAQILNLLSDLKEQLDLSMLFVTHNLKVVAHIADSVLVMRNGDIVEMGPVDRVMTAPADPYTCDLMGAGRRTGQIKIEAKE